MLCNEGLWPDEPGFALSGSVPLAQSCQYNCGAHQLFRPIFPETVPHLFAGSGQIPRYFSTLCFLHVSRLHKHTSVVQKRLHTMMVYFKSEQGREFWLAKACISLSEERIERREYVYVGHFPAKMKQYF